MGLLGFGLSMLGKAVLKEAIIQGATQYQEDVNRKNLTYQVYRQMSNYQLVELVIRLSLEEASDLFGDKEREKIFEEVLLERIRSGKITTWEIDTQWWDFFDMHEEELWELYQNEHEYDDDPPDRSVFIRERKLDFDSESLFKDLI
jgi:hypothetical protein